MNTKGYNQSITYHVNENLQSTILYNIPFRNEQLNSGFNAFSVSKCLICLMKLYDQHLIELQLKFQSILSMMQNDYKNAHGIMLNSFLHKNFYQAFKFINLQIQDV